MGDGPLRLGAIALDAALRFWFIEVDWSSRNACWDSAAVRQRPARPRSATDQPKTSEAAMGAACRPSASLQWEGEKERSAQDASDVKTLHEGTPRIAEERV